MANIKLDNQNHYRALIIDVASIECAYKEIAARDLSRTWFLLEFLALKTLVLIIYPIMPDFSEKMWNLLEHNQPMLWTDVPTFAHNKQKIDLESINVFTSMPEGIYKLHK